MLTMNLLASVTPILLLLLLPATQGVKEKPHIVLIVADDLGWSDVGFRDPAMATPVIDKLASEGVLLNFSYMMKSGTPSRSSLFTGLYAFRMGLQNKTMVPNKNNFVPLDKRFFPQDLQAHGYSTHYVGKWNLGFCRKEMTPTYRGFDTFYGTYNGEVDYYSHKTEGGYDMQDNKGEHLSVVTSGGRKYSTELFTNKAVKIIKKHDVSTPLFLVLSYQAVHSLLKVPQDYRDKYCANVTVGGKDRKKHCAMAAAMDEGIGQVMAALDARGLSENLILLFTSDNGGPIDYGSTNWPLRGAKSTDWEGGTRVVSILHSKKYLPDAPFVWNGIIHVVDWYPTLLKAAGINMDNTTQIDGINLWRNIVNKKVSKRKEFVSLYDRKDVYSFRYRKYKLVNFTSTESDGWFSPPPGQGDQSHANGDDSQLKLFNIKKDPTERNNLIKTKKGRAKFKDVMVKMKRKVRKYQKKMVPITQVEEITVDPVRDLGGNWKTGWC